MSFSKNVPRDLQEHIQALWGAHDSKLHEKYHGLQTLIEKSRKQDFHDVKTMVWQKFQCWKEQLLSQRGKEVLLKTVMLATPTYTMSCFLLPKSLIVKLEELMAGFWWGQRKMERKIH